MRPLVRALLPRWNLYGLPTNGTRVSNIGNCLFCQRSSVNGNIHGYQLQNLNAFFQDDWKVSSRLTVNLGVRWEYDGSLTDQFGNLTNFWASDLAATPAADIPSAIDTNNAILTLQGNPNAFRGYVVPSNYNTNSVDAGGHGPIPSGVRQFDGIRPSQNRVPLGNFAPRIGFAWQPTASGRLVIRRRRSDFYDVSESTAWFTPSRKGAPTPTRWVRRTIFPACSGRFRKGR